MKSRAWSIREKNPKPNKEFLDSYTARRIGQWILN